MSYLHPDDTYREPPPDRTYHDPLAHGLTKRAQRYRPVPPACGCTRFLVVEYEDAEYGIEVIEVMPFSREYDLVTEAPYTDGTVYVTPRPVSEANDCLKDGAFWLD